MLRQLRKELYHLGCQWPNDKKMLVYIGGVQRSGTTMLQEVFCRDRNAYSYGETGLCDSERQLLPHAELDSIVARHRGNIHVIKPLCSAHVIEKYVGAEPTKSRAIWIYRHYADVVKSDLRRWGHLRSELRRMRAFVDYRGCDVVDTWASFGATDSVRETVARYYSEEMAPEDAAALYWWARNQLWSNTGLCNRQESMLLNYHAILRRPDYWMRHVYRLLDRKYPGDHAIYHIRQGGGKHGEIGLSVAIQELCEAMWECLCQAHRQQELSLQRLRGQLPLTPQKESTMSTVLQEAA